MQFPYLRSVDESGCRPTQSLPILPRMSQASPSLFPQYFPFEFGENCEQSSHRSTGRRGQVQRLRQGTEPDTQMLPFLKGRQQIRYRAAPAIQTPDEHHIDLPSASGFQ